MSEGTRLIGVDTQASLEAVLDRALDERTPDAIIASGDLAHDPYDYVYARFYETVRTRTDAPLLCLPGNHDVLASMQAAGLPLRALEVGPWSLVPLDSHEDDKTPSLITDDDRAAVAAALAAAQGAHVLVATHHPLVVVDCPWLDRDRIQNGDAVIHWLSECSPKLRGVVFGHAHQVVEGFCGGLPVYGVPSTCFQFKPKSQQFSLDDTTPGYRWLALGDDGELVTRVERTDFVIEAELGAAP